MSILVQPVAVPAPAQVAPERVDALVLAPAVVLGTLILVWGDQQTLLRGAPLPPGQSLSTQNSTQRGLPDYQGRRGSTALVGLQGPGP